MSGKRNSQLFRFVLIKRVNRKQNQTHLASDAQGVPAVGDFPPPPPRCNRLARMFQDLGGEDILNKGHGLAQGKK